MDIYRKVIYRTYQDNLYRKVQQKKSKSINVKLRHYYTVFRPEIPYTAEIFIIKGAKVILKLDVKKRTILRKILCPWIIQMEKDTTDPMMSSIKKRFKLTNIIQRDHIRKHHYGTNKLNKIFELLTSLKHEYMIEKLTEKRYRKSHKLSLRKE